MNRSARHMRVVVVRLLAMLVAVCAIVGIRGATRANAYTGEKLTVASASDYQSYFDGGRIYFFGMIGYDGQQRRYYCMDQSQETNYTLGVTKPMPDTLVTRLVGEMLNRHQREHNVDDLQAALAFIVHDAFDTSQGDAGWPHARGILESQYPNILAKAREFYEEVRPVVPQSIATRVEYTDGKRAGNIVLEILNDEGTPTTNTEYSVSLEGDAVFANGAKTRIGRTNGKTLRFAWKASGEGAVRVHAQMQVPAVEMAVSSQNLLRVAAAKTVEAAGTAFDTVTVFSPTLVTQTTPKSTDPGSAVTDDVTMRLDGDDNYWPADSAVEASGWYFTGLRGENLDSVIRPNAGEPAREFLGRLKRLGFEPAAYGNATFTNDGQRRQVQAVSEENGTEPYRAHDGDAYGTWVWAVERQRQPSAVQQVMTHDWVSGFMEPAETNVTRTPVQVRSQAGEHSAHVGAMLTDVIEVSGFPHDHSEFGGNEQYGLAADEPYAQVSVWWAGDGNGGDDEPYRPQGEAEPEEDEHHTLIGNWDVPARNGTLRFGGGQADAHGDAVTLQAARPGWYVFIWKFKGDARAMPQESAYGDSWECVRVVRESVHAEPAAEGMPADERKNADPSASPTQRGVRADPAKSVTRQPTPVRLARTGVSMGGVALMGAVIVTAIAMLLVAHRRHAMSLRREDGEHNAANAGADEHMGTGKE